MTSHWSVSAETLDCSWSIRSFGETETSPPNSQGVSVLPPRQLHPESRFLPSSPPLQLRAGRICHTGWVSPTAPWTLLCGDVRCLCLWAALCGGLRTALRTLPPHVSTLNILKSSLPRCGQHGTCTCPMNWRSALACPHQSHTHCHRTRSAAWNSRYAPFHCVGQSTAELHWKTVVNPLRFDV